MGRDAPRRRACRRARQRIQLGLRAMGVGPGDEVIVPAFTAVPTASAVCAVGAVPVLVDVDPATAAMDLAAARAAVTDRTKAVVPVHLYGRPAPVPELGVPVLEDAAQAHGALARRHRARRRLQLLPDEERRRHRRRRRARHRRRRARRDGAAAARPRHDRAVRPHRRVAELPHDRARGGVAAPRAAPTCEAGNARRRADRRAYRAAAPGPASGTPTTPTTCTTSASCASPDRDAFARGAAGAGVATAVHYPLALTQQPAYRQLRARAVPGGRGVGGVVRHAAVLPRAHRRRGGDGVRARWRTT